MRLFIFLLTMSAQMATAQSWPDLTCQGHQPDWHLSIGQESAAFTFTSESQLSIPHAVRAEGRDWPLALTLIGRDESAIAILRPRTDGSPDLLIDVLTQVGDAPVILTGICQSRS